jgi:hypothetical protein
MPLRLIRPYIVGFVLIVIVWVSSPQQVYAYVPALHETIELYIPVEYNIPLKVVLTAITLIVVLLIHLRRDYGKFIPNRWDMKVFFDNEGLESVVNSFSDEERKKLRIPDDWQNYSAKFINHLNQLLERYDKSQIAKFGENTLGFGSFSYQYQKVPGQQKYHLYDGHGFVEFKFSSREESISILAKFQQLPKGTDYVEPSIADMYRFNTVVAPTFRQIISMDDLRHREIAAITCPTRIKFWPTVEVSKTLYMTDITELRSTIRDIPKNMPMIPYAYAVNQVQHHQH